MLGFQPSKSRYYKHPECPHLFLEFPKGPVEIGDEFPITPDELEVEGRTLRLLSPTDSVKDRLAGYIHWQSRANFDQAVLICRRQADRIDLKAVRSWCERRSSPSLSRTSQSTQRLGKLAQAARWTIPKRQALTVGARLRPPTHAAGANCSGAL